MTAIPQLNFTGPPPTWDSGSLQHWQDCVAWALAEPGAWLTPPRPGLPRLRQALAQHLELDADRLSITNGIRASVGDVVRGARRLVLERPTFADIATLGREAGAEVCTASWSELLQTTWTTDTVVWLTSPARNPDGRSLSADEAAAVDRLGESSRAVVVSQAYRWLRPDAPTPRRAVLLGSLHKLAGGGVSLGWRHDPVGTRLIERPPTGGPPRPWQLAWARFIEEDGLEPLAAALRRAAQRCRRFATLLTPRWTNLVRAGDGVSLLLALPSEAALAEALRLAGDAGMRLSDGAAFLAPAPCVRLSFTGVADADVLESGRLWDRILQSVCDTPHTAQPIVRTNHSPVAARG